MRARNDVNGDDCADTAGRFRAGIDGRFNGGDVAFHGRRQDGNETPIPGNIDSAANGSGMAGDFAGE